MAVTAFSSGTQTATIGTEHFLANVDQAGVFILEVDVNALAAGDIVELRVYRMVLAGGTARLESVYTFMGVQEILVKRAIPISNDHNDAQALRFSLKQTFGTGRAFPWKVLKHA